MKNELKVGQYFQFKDKLLTTMHELAGEVAVVTAKRGHLYMFTLPFAKNNSIFSSGEWSISPEQIECDVELIPKEVLDSPLWQVMNEN